MKALVWHATNDVRVERVPDPRILNGRDAIVKITTSAICGTDLHAFEGTQPYFAYPRILGHELAGELVKANGAPAEFKEGEALTFIPYFNCGTCIACRSNKPNQPTN